MEHTLDLYQQPYDPAKLVVCVDEKNKHLLFEVRTPLPMEPGMPQRYDSHYKREGTANIFVAFVPLRNWRGTKVTTRRTQVDFVHFIKWLVDDVHPDARIIHLVLDNLNMHTPAAFMKPFLPSKRIAWPNGCSSTTRQNTGVG